MAEVFAMPALALQDVCKGGCLAPTLWMPVVFPSFQPETPQPTSQVPPGGAHVAGEGGGVWHTTAA